MLYYRLYFMNPRSGHIDSVVDFEAADDKAAEARAIDFLGRTPLELWCEGRKVRRFEAIMLGEAAEPVLRGPLSA